MRDPKLIIPPDDGIPERREEWRRNYLTRPIDKLPGDVVLAFDRVHNLTKENNKLRHDLLAAERSLGWAKVIDRALMLVVTGEGCVIGWVVKAFLAAHIK